MTTFNLAEIRRFAADLDARWDRCENGEGMECANLDDSLRCYATLCCEFLEEVRRWAREVFAGRVSVDPEVEREWVEKGRRLHDRARGMLAYGETVEDECYVLDGRDALQSALWELEQLLNGWVTPKLAVGPSARLGFPFDPSAAQEVHQRVQKLPPLPADWKPNDPQQQKLYRKLRKRRTS